MRSLISHMIGISLEVDNLFLLLPPMFSQPFLLFIRLDELNKTLEFVVELKLKLIYNKKRKQGHLAHVDPKALKEATVLLFVVFGNTLMESQGCLVRARWVDTQGYSLFLKLCCLKQTLSFIFFLSPSACPSETGHSYHKRGSCLCPTISSQPLDLA